MTTLSPTYTHRTVIGATLTDLAASPEKSSCSPSPTATSGTHSTKRVRIRKTCDDVRPTINIHLLNTPCCATINSPFPLSAPLSYFPPLLLSCHCLQVWKKWLPNTPSPAARVVWWTTYYASRRTYWMRLRSTCRQRLSWLQR